MITVVPTTRRRVWKLVHATFKLKRGCLWVHEFKRTPDMFRVDASSNVYQAWMQTKLKRVHNERNSNDSASFWVTRQELNQIMEADS